MMNISDIDVTTTGISFSVQPSFRFGTRRDMSARTCFVDNQTLDDLAVRRSYQSYLPEEIFRRFESEITGIAIRLALAGVEGKPLLVRDANFNETND